MAYDDMGGVVTQLVLTCKTKSYGVVSIRRGDALQLVGPYTVDNTRDVQGVIFGQALAEANDNDAAIPVKVRGVCVFEYTDCLPPLIDGSTGVMASVDRNGCVESPRYVGTGQGRNLSVDESAKLVHVLL